MKNYKIAVAGTGYVGLSLSVLLAQHNQVMAVDIVQAKVDMINNHKSPIQDDYIEKYTGRRKTHDEREKLSQMILKLHDRAEAAKYDGDSSPPYQEVKMLNFHDEE